MEKRGAGTNPVDEPARLAGSIQPMMLAIRLLLGIMAACGSALDELETKLHGSAYSPLIVAVARQHSVTRKLLAALLDRMAHDGFEEPQ